MTNIMYRQCSRCVMDTSDPEISFNDTGYCNHCTTYLENKKTGNQTSSIDDKKLQGIVKKIKHKGKNKEYDCIMGISGGIDSCYTAYILKNLGLRVLLVHLDNGWDSELSVQNIKAVVNNLGFDYESYVLDWEEFRDLQIAFLKASVIEAETPTDIAILGSLHKVAASYGIQYVISGGNLATEGILPAHWHYDAKDTKFFNAVHKKFGSKKIKSFPNFGFWKEVYYKFIKGIRIVYILNYIPFTKKEAISVLETELNWKQYGGKHHESKFTAFIQSYLLPVKFNLDYRKATLSTQICTGEISREQALEELKESPYNAEKIKYDTEYVSKKLNISDKEFEMILNDTPKTYKDYPNNEMILKRIYRLYNFIFK